MRSCSHPVRLGWSATGPGPGHKTNVISGPALKHVSDGAGWRNPSEPTKQNMLEAFHEADQSHARRAREGREQNGPAQSRTTLRRRRSLPFQLPLPLFCFCTQPAQVQLCSVIVGKSVYFLGPVSSSVKWEVGRLHHLPEGRPRENPVWVGFRGAWRLRKRSPHPDFEILLLHRYCFQVVPGAEAR